MHLPLRLGLLSIACHLPPADVHRPESKARPTALVVRERWFEKARGGPESDDTLTGDKAQAEADFPTSFKRTGGAKKYQDVTSNGMVVNHLLIEPNPREKLMGRTAAFMLIGFTVFMSMVIYTVNWPDPQVANYGNKLVSTSMSIYCAVLVEKIAHACLDPLLVHPICHWWGYSTKSLGFIWVAFVVSLFTFFAWFLFITLFAYMYRTSPESLFAVKAFVSHVCAFMAIYSFGYFEKHYCKRCKDFDTGVLCYAWFPVWVFIVIYAFGFVSKALREKVEPPGEVEGAEHAPGSSPPARHSLTDACHALQWKHIAKEGEDEAMAIVVSFLIRQCVLFIATARIPSTKGDMGPHSQVMWNCIWVVLAITLLATMIATYAQESYNHQWHGLHNLQELLTMTFAWVLLTSLHWLCQNYCTYVTAWNMVTAFAMTPMSFGAVVVVDKLADIRLFGRASEHVVLNSLGIMLGFAWEVAFASGIDSVTHSMKVHYAVECLLCGILIAFVLPSWRLYVLPKAFIAIPPRDEKKGGEHSASGGQLASPMRLDMAARASGDFQPNANF